MINKPCDDCQAVHSFKHVMNLTEGSNASPLFAVSIEKRGIQRERERERE